MTENGTTSPITERGNIGQMGQPHAIATERASHPGQAEQLDNPDGARGLATAVQSPTEQDTTRQLSAGQPATGQPAPASRTTSRAQAGAEARDQVMVKMPADGAYLSVLRTATAGLAARLDFTLDEIEDMRIAVDEACAMLLNQAIPGSNLQCAFALGQDEMTVSVSVRCLAPRVPAGDTFAWTVLSALAGSVDAQVGPGDVLTIVLRKCRDSSRSV
jgi:serine/threonine-protein kinase RsbW